ncbi:transposase [Asaia bogorensis NBRC 16594]|uniref:Transposase n=1 Tax=Asaia bogorensis NBRC 16594 TaxID=1231624 RepID=A0AAN4R4Y6_9PROT|nr:transposase [Asaia bogorensis NBRC 16594]GEL54467.1 hypothetical protein ABO01nite_24740 [Asaia bogorensis NBRC 16594]
MGKVTRKRYSGEFKSRVALGAIRGEQTLAELASKYGVHQTMIAQWKRQAIEGMAATFSGKQAPEATTSPVDVEKLRCCHINCGVLDAGDESVICELQTAPISSRADRSCCVVVFPFPSELSPCGRDAA